jgi:hypothetical protein
VLLSHDLFALDRPDARRLLEVRAEMTVVGGQIVHVASGHR